MFACVTLQNNKLTFAEANLYKSSSLKNSSSTFKRLCYIHMQIINPIQEPSWQALITIHQLIIVMMTQKTVSYISFRFVDMR